ncbi:LuxR C-terminal-related transcriptional regulator [Bradyrhizobium sp. CIAT3101]|uniref:helix-turn-helix transcriptional regulator n=1 Tax=Bradyrhizobium sp. CIAT3101 TaxID=439387 RepID=UPI0024B119A0|nr:LuxR C-terminal-related transcriptional regulator [Bradyrhizobium sp. CIAT3101]WFU84063.1 LuxR C-terminal-related transcriptional regulator [Bradyrhizobium sp. CIAT3101]
MELNDELLSLVGNIYDAALDDSRWTMTLASIVDLAGGQGGGLVRIGARGEAVISHAVGVDLAYVRSYIETYEPFDPSRAVLHAPVGQIQTIGDWIDVDEFRKTMFYNDWTRPQGLEDAANILLDKSSDGISRLSIMKAGGPVDRKMYRVISHLTPHMQRAMHIRQKLQQQNALEATSARTLDALRAAILLLDANGHITHSNASAQEILDEADVLRSVHGRLVTSDLNADRMLRQALAGTALGDRAGLSLHLAARDGSHYVGHLVALTAGRRKTFGAGYEACAVLFVSKAAIDTIVAPDLIRKLFKLTPAELRVFLSIVEVGGVPDVAKSMGVAETTIKTHLARIFTKTGTKRQADLVRLVAAFTPPIKI